jgi:hypothetical protein
MNDASEKRAVRRTLPHLRVGGGTSRICGKGWCGVSRSSGPLSTSHLERRCGGVATSLRRSRNVSGEGGGDTASPCRHSGNPLFLAFGAREGVCRRGEELPQSRVLGKAARVAEWTGHWEWVGSSSIAHLGRGRVAMKKGISGEREKRLPLRLAFGARGKEGPPLVRI